MWGKRRFVLGSRGSSMGAVLLFVMLLTGCTTTGGTAVVATSGASRGSTGSPSVRSTVPSGGGTGSSPTTSPPPSSFPAPVAGGEAGLLWTQRASTPLGQPRPVGDGVAVYVLAGSALAIQVVDAASGQVRWQQAAATGAVAAGVEIHPAVVDGRVAYLRPVDGSMVATSVVVADPVTGRDIAVTSTADRVTSRPTACRHLVCFSAYSGSAQQSLTLDPTTGRVSSAGAGSGGREIGPEGLESAQSAQQPEQLFRSVDGAVLWKTPLAAIFGAGYSTDGGWEFHSQSSRGVLVGSVGRYDAATPTPAEIKVGVDRTMAGIGLSDGARRWVQTGDVEYQCLPQAAVTENGALVDVRCRWGSASVAQRVGNSFVLRSATIALEGFDPATGRTTWSVPLADPTGQTPQATFAGIEVVGEQTLLVPGARGELLVDPVTGATQPAPADTAAVCVSGINTPLAGGERTVGGRTSNDFATGAKAVRCTAHGDPSPRTDTTWPSWIGVTVKGVHVVTTAAGLQGYRS